MAVEIQIVAGEPSQRQRVRLDGVYFVLELRWNDRAAAWVLDVLDAEEQELVRGIPLRIGVRLLRKHGGRALPAGELVVVDTSQADRDPTLEDLGGRAKLLYLDAAELAELEAGA